MATVSPKPSATTRRRLVDADKLLEELREVGLDVRRSTLTRWTRRNRIPVTRINCRSFLYDLEKVLTALHLID